MWKVTGGLFVCGARFSTHIFRGYLTDYVNRLSVILQIVNGVQGVKFTALSRIPYSRGCLAIMTGISRLPFVSWTLYLLAIYLNSS
jgi:hypothetical protein